MTKPTPDAALCLIASAEADAGHRSRLAAALDATRAATLILTAPDDGKLDPAVVRGLIEDAQQKGTAVLIANDIAIARETGADGVHLSWRPEIEDAYEAARNALGPDAIVGADAGDSRHDAMTLGEHGADYVAFGRTTATNGEDTAREIQDELVGWWAEVFTVPVVVFDIETADEARSMSARGADFVAVRLPRATDADNDAAWASALVAALGATGADAA